MGHDGCAQDATGLVKTFGFYECARREVSSKDFAYATVDLRQLDAEADDYAEDKQADKEFKQTQALHGAVGSVEEENGHDVKNREGDAGDEGQLGDQEVESDGGTNDFGHVGGYDC